MKTKDRNGFTLLEVIVCAGLLGLIAAPIVGLMHSSLRTWDDQATRGSSGALGQDTLRWITERIGQANQIVSVRATDLTLQSTRGVERIFQSGNSVYLEVSGVRSLVAGPVTSIRFADQRGGTPRRSLGVQVTVNPLPSHTGITPASLVSLAVPEWVTP
jgi:prepilin-type N-terminal cleavage/methylation domain-containing protein